MPRDPIIRQAFEIADDGMQAVIGYYFYVAACQYLAKPQAVWDYPSVA